MGIKIKFIFSVHIETSLLIVKKISNHKQIICKKPLVYAIIFQN